MFYTLQQWNQRYKVHCSVARCRLCSQLCNQFTGLENDWQTDACSCI